MARTKRRKYASVTGLTWRGPGAYWQREHARLPGATEDKPGRVFKSLRTKDAEQATERATLLNRIGWERGDWDLIARWAADEIDITDLIRADREGQWKPLRQLHLDGVKLEDAAKAYMAQVRANASKRTITMYRSVVDRAVAALGSRAMHHVTTPDARAYLHANRGATGDSGQWSPRTASTHRVVLAALWDFAMADERQRAEAKGALATIQHNPWRETKSPKIKRTRFSYLRAEEARALLGHSSVVGTPVEALLAVAIYAGLRLGEIANLRTDIDVVLGDDWRMSLLIVQPREGEHAWRPKTERSWRKLRPIPALYERLVYHRKEFAGARYFFKPEYRDEPPNSGTIARWVQAAFEAAGIRYGRTGDALTLHSLRHTFATWQVSAGVPLTTVAKRMGDTEIVVLRTYAHCMPEQDELADRVMQEAASVTTDKKPSTLNRTVRKGSESTAKSARRPANAR